MFTVIMSLLIATAPVESARQDIQQNLDEFDKACMERGLTKEECHDLVNDKDLK